LGIGFGAVITQAWDEGCVEFTSKDAAPACGQDLIEGPGGAVPGGESRGRRLACLLESASQPFVGVDFEGRITCLNRAFADLAGASREVLLNRPLADVTPPRWREAQAKALAKVRSTGVFRRFATECLRLDGKLVPIEVVVEPDHDARGELVGVYAFVTDTTTRKAADDALRESEERFRRLYDDAPVGYHEVDAEGRIVNINRTECELLGYPREELLGHSVFERIAEEDREAARHAFPEKIAGARPLRSFERAITTRDGRRLTVLIEERYKRDEQGQVVGLLSTIQDVTDRKRTEAALQASERRARALFEGIDEAVFVHALDGRILDANAAASRLLGYSREELLSMTTAEIDDPSFATGYEERLTRQMTTGHLSCEGRHRTKSGRVIPVEINTATIRLDEEKVVLAVIRDISERQALEETRQALAEAQSRNAREIEAKNAELTLSEARYRQLTEGCLDGVVVADQAGLITLFNPAAERMFGHTASEAIGQPLTILMPPSYRDAHGAGLARFVRTRESRLVGKTVELVGRRKNGEDFPMELSLNAVERGGEVQFIGSIRDQTERHRMRAMLAQSEKLASIGLLSAGVAHEINNPLAYVANNVAVLERDLSSVVEMIELYETAQPALESIAPVTLQEIRTLAEGFDWPYVRENLPRMLTRTREGVQRVASIVSNLRGLARTSPPKMESVRVSDLLETALEMIRGRMRRHQIDVVVEYGDVPPLVCVPAQISQVLLNLLINAVQSVETCGRAEGGKIRFASSVSGSMAILAVSDNGPGIEPESVPRLFDPFFTTKSVGEGTGLGLSICHGIVTGHGGRIEVESRLGAGATFRVLLPLK
jgi:two-component system, NtrC family, sensor kinase